MINIFIDTEFTDLNPFTMKLISLGAYALKGDEVHSYYVELSDTYKRQDCSTFVKKVVLPLLEGKNVQTKHQMILSFCKFIEDFEEDVRLISDAPSWDFPHINDILTDPAIRPANLKACAVAQKYMTIPEAFTTREHHALDDAMVNALVVRDLERQGQENGIKDILWFN